MKREDAPKRKNRHHYSEAEIDDRLKRLRRMFEVLFELKANEGLRSSRFISMRNHSWVHEVLKVLRFRGYLVFHQPFYRLVCSPRDITNTLLLKLATLSSDTARAARDRREPLASALDEYGIFELSRDPSSPSVESPLVEASVLGIPDEDDGQPSLGENESSESDDLEGGGELLEGEYHRIQVPTIKSVANEDPTLRSPAQSLSISRIVPPEAETGGRKAEGDSKILRESFEEILFVVRTTVPNLISVNQQLVETVRELVISNDVLQGKIDRLYTEWFPEKQKRD